MNLTQLVLPEGIFDLIGWHVDSHAATSLQFDTIEHFERSVIDYIDRGIPIMVDWVDWAGHWQVIIGSRGLYKARFGVCRSPKELRAGRSYGGHHS